MDYKHPKKVRTGYISAAQNAKKKNLKNQGWKKKVGWVFKENGKEIAFCVCRTGLCSTACDYTRRVPFPWETPPSHCQVGQSITEVLSWFHSFCFQSMDFDEGL